MKPSSPLPSFTIFLSNSICKVCRLHLTAHADNIVIEQLAFVLQCLHFTVCQRVVIILNLQYCKPHALRVANDVVNSLMNALSDVVSSDGRES